MYKTGETEGKRIMVPTSAFVSILIGVISLWICIVNGREMMSYNKALDLAYLSEENIELNRYVKGTISDCVTVPVLNDPNVVSGSSGQMLGFGGIPYENYTVPILGDRYIRIWINNKETIKGMESLVNGEVTEVSFSGVIKEGEPLNTEWYSWNSKFDQSKVVADYVIWQKTVDKEKNLCFAGLFGIMIAALIYNFYGRVQIIEAQPEKPQSRQTIYNKENEILTAKIHLERYKEQERAYRKKGVIGMVCIGMGFLFVLVLGWNLICLLLIFYGIKKCWSSFINSDNWYAMALARLFSVETLQTKKAMEECRIEMLEQENEDF